MTIAHAETATPLAEEVFQQLKRGGALCVSQLAVELLVRTELVKKALQELSGLGLVEKKLDREEYLNQLEDEIPWRIRRWT